MRRKKEERAQSPTGPETETRALPLKPPVFRCCQRWLEETRSTILIPRRWVWRRRSNTYHPLRSLAQTSEPSLAVLPATEKCPTLSWTTLLARFEARVHSSTNRARASRKLRPIKFAQFHRWPKSESEVFKAMVAEIDRLACLGQEEDQTSYALCSILCWAKEGQECSLHPLTKKGVEHDFSVSVESIAHSITKFDLHHSSHTQSNDACKTEWQQLYSSDS